MLKVQVLRRAKRIAISVGIMGDKYCSGSSSNLTVVICCHSSLSVWSLTWYILTSLPLNSLPLTFLPICDERSELLKGLDTLYSVSCRRGVSCLEVFPCAIFRANAALKARHFAPCPISPPPTSVAVPCKHRIHSSEQGERRYHPRLPCPFHALT